MNDDKPTPPDPDKLAELIASTPGGSVPEPGAEEEAKERERKRIAELEVSKKKYPNYHRLHEAIKKKYQKDNEWIHIYFDSHREDEGYDNVTIEIVPRYKQSHLSGDEWRFSYVAKVWWKGFLIGHTGWSKMEHATRCLDHWLNYMNEIIEFRYKEYSDGSGKEEMIAFPDHRLRAEFCAQPGCPNLATHTFVKKKTWTKNGMAETTKPNHVHVIRYCAQHATRGDCALEDSDANLELFEALAERDESERYKRSVRSGVVVVELEKDKFGQGSIPMHHIAEIMKVVVDETSPDAVREIRPEETN